MSRVLDILAAAGGGRFPWPARGPRGWRRDRGRAARRTLHDGPGRAPL